MDRELARILGIRGGPRRSRWFGEGVSQCLGKFESGTTEEPKINWNRVLGLATILITVTAAWTVIGVALSRFLR